MGVDDELAGLRRRAYGPDADILADPVALARLRELEAQVRAARPVGAARPDGAASEAGGVARVRDVTELRPNRPGIPDSPDIPDSRGGAEPGPGDGSGGSGIGDPAPQVGDGDALPERVIAPVRAVGDVEPRERRLPRRIRVAGAASLVVAIALAAGVAVWVFPFGARDAAQHAARLTPQPGGESPDAFWGDMVDMQYFGTYQGLEVYAGGGCLSVSFGTESAHSGTGGCTGEGLLPIADFTVPASGSDRFSYGTDVEFPAELSSRYPDGATLRFTARDGEVLVDIGELADVYRGMAG